MNNKFIELLKKHNDTNFAEWLFARYKLNLNVFSKYPYSAQIGILQHYLFDYHNISIKYDRGRSITVYHNNDKEVLADHKTPTDAKDFVSLAALAIAEPIKNKYLPF